MPNIRHISILLLGLALAAGGAAAANVQVDAQALGAHPDGDFGEVTELDELLDFGYGFRGDVLFGLNDHVYVGGQAGWFTSGGDLFEGVDADIESIPVHGLVQLRAQKGIGLFVQAGAGFTHQSRDHEGSVSLSQDSFSWLAGGGLIVGLPGPIALIGGVDYATLNPDDGDIWRGDDNVHFWLLSVGIRFHTK